MRRLAALAPTVLACLLGLATALLGTGSLGSALVLLAALLTLAASGAPLWLLVTRRTDPLELLFAGLLLGLVLLGIGTVLAGWTGVLPIRWLPALAGLACWVPAWRRRRLVARPRRPGWEVWGVVAAQVILLPSLLAMLSTAPLDWDGWRSFHVDPLYHTGFVAESLDRAPAVYPYAADLSLGYTWLLGGVLGALGGLTRFSALELALHVGPAMMSALLPPLIAVAARAVTRSRLAVLLAPLVIAFADAPLLGFSPALDITPQWLMSNRDFSHLAALLAVVVALRARPWGAGKLRWAPSWALLFAVAFGAAASKGSALPVLAGAFGLVALAALVTRSSRLRRIGDAVAVALGVLVAQFGVTKGSQYLRIDPLTFFGTLVPPGRTGQLLVAATMAVLLALIAFLVLTALAARELRVPMLYVVGGGAAGIAGLAILGHPGLSQLYFLHAAWPLLVVGVVAAVVRWSRTYPAYLPALAAASLAVALLLTAPPQSGRPLWGLGIAGLAVLVALASALPVLPGLLRRRPGPVVVLATVGTALLGGAFAVQNWALPHVVIQASAPATADDPAAVSGRQLDALRALRSASGPTELVMTNKHCRTGSVPTGDCDARWFPVAAIGERRVLVEGFSYTKLSEGVPSEDRYWNPALLAENDRFFTEPTAEECARFAARGVDLLYVDRRIPSSPQLADFGDPITVNPDAAVYRLDCGAG